MDPHGCRSVPYPPSPINAVAFSHSFVPRSERGAVLAAVRLAVGRANGDIELWNPRNGDWLQEAVIRGARDRSVDALAWAIEEPDDGDVSSSAPAPGRARLFSIGY